jgi:hypothetical protein
MSDLISRKVVMDWLRDLQAQAIINRQHGTLVDATIEASINSFINFIVQVPTAYDVDKVVEQLEFEFLNSKGNLTKEYAIAKALEIVMKGAAKDE